jgi:hypothetical protein
MLNIDRAHDATAAHEGHRQKGFVTVLGQLMKKLKARVLRGFFRNRYRLVMFRHPTGDPLPDAEFEAIDRIGMRVLGSAEDQVFAIDNVDEAGIAPDQSGDKLDDSIQNLMKSVGRGETTANLVEEFKGRFFDAQ